MSPGGKINAFSNILTRALIICCRNDWKKAKLFTTLFNHISRDTCLLLQSFISNLHNNNLRISTNNVVKEL